MNKSTAKVLIYTDGSCHTQHKIGGWAAIIKLGDKEISIKGSETNTTHNRMELSAVIEALNYLQNQNLSQTETVVMSDSQYVIGIKHRVKKLKTSNYTTKKGKSIQNKDLVEQLIHYIETMNLQFKKIKAHLKKTSVRNYNRDVDKLSRQIVRELVKEKYM